MLDAATLALLAKLKLLTRKTGVEMDLVRMSSEAVYAESILKELSNTDDPEVVLIAVQLMNQFGMIDAPAAKPKTDDKKDDGRYVGSLR